MDGVAESFEALHEALLDTLPIEGIKVQGTEFTIRPTPGQEVIDNDQNGVPEGDERTLLAAPGGKASILGREVSILGLARRVGYLDQHLT